MAKKNIHKIDNENALNAKINTCIEYDSWIIANRIIMNPITLHDTNPVVNELLYLLNFL